MAINLEVTTDVRKAQRDAWNVMSRQIPFATAGAVADTAFDIRRRIVGSTYPKAFTVRNKRWPGVLFRVKGEDNLPIRGAARAFARGLRERGEASLYVGEAPDKVRDWVEMHLTGGTKRPHKGSSVVIPARGKAEALRTKSGRIKAAQKPLRITKRRDTFLITKGGRKHAIVRRKKDGELERIYNFAREAKIAAKFRFFPDAFDTFDRVFDGHFNARLTQAMRSRKR